VLLPARTSIPTIPQYLGWILIMDVMIEIAARVKKKFQWTPYSPTWTYKVTKKDMHLQEDSTIIWKSRLDNFG
jgi:hypothetical protein